MKQIIAIGGNCFPKDTQYTFEKYAIGLTKKENPRVLFLSQASAEAQSYVVSFYQTFCALGAQPSSLSLFGSVRTDLEEIILEQDIIFVGGGNTRSMIALWKEWDVGKSLKKAYDAGIILMGVSAGAICWFEQGITDSLYPLSVMNGLGILPGTCCPHYDSEKNRKPFYLEQVKNKKTLPGIALPDGVAAHYVDDQLFKIITNQEGKTAFYIDVDGEKSID